MQRVQPLPQRFRPSLTWAGALLLLAGLLLLAPYLFQATELVRVRHALVLGPDFSPEQDWAPPHQPADFLAETVPPDPFFVAIARDIQLDTLANDWERGLAISRHLLEGSPHLRGGASHDDLRHTYVAIKRGASGYCGDFVRVFSAIAHAGGLTVRPWAFSLDEFGGHGHIFVEVWNRELRRWQLIDVFQNYYFTRGSGLPLSALEFRHALLVRAPDLRLNLLHPGAVPGWAVEAKAMDYFQRGLDGWFVPWGSNLFTYDSAWPIRAFSGVSRVAEGISALLLGVHPKVRMLATPTNEPQRRAMRELRTRVLLAGGLGLGGLLLVGAGLARRWVRGGPGRQALSVAWPETEWPRIGLVGPLPPPAGGMANQCEQLQRLLQAEGAQVTVVRSNAPYRPRWVGRLPMVRALCRLLPYALQLWRAAGRVQVLHVFANSGWAWHLFAAPALWVGRWRGVPVVVNYRGGQADEFLSAAPRQVHRLLAQAAARVTPSAFLQRVFARHGLQARTVPNVVDLTRFPVQPWRAEALSRPHLLVARHLEPIYDIATALRCFARVRQTWPGARLTVAGAGPDLESLQQLARTLGVADAVAFVGRVDNADMPALYAEADVALNSSTVDNMPISLLEALASGVPVVSTAAGGIPDLVEDGRTALLAPVGDDETLARQVHRVLQDRALALALREAGLAEAARYAWAAVRGQWLDVYRQAAGLLPAEVRVAGST